LTARATYWLTGTVPAGWPESSPQEIVTNRIRFDILPALIVAGAAAKPRTEVVARRRP
jgi:hypothetical protein